MSRFSFLLIYTKKTHTHFFCQCLWVKNVKKQTKKKKCWNYFATQTFVSTTTRPRIQTEAFHSRAHLVRPLASCCLPFPWTLRLKRTGLLHCEQLLGKKKKKKKVRKKNSTRPRITFRSLAKVCSSSGSSVSWSCRVLRQSESCSGLLQECFRGPASFPHLGFKCTFELLKAHRCV